MALRADPAGSAVGLEPESAVGLEPGSAVGLRSGSAPRAPILPDQLPGTVSSSLILGAMAKPVNPYNQAKNTPR